MWYTVSRETMTYDSTGRCIRTENLAGETTAEAWDCCHRVLETRPDGSTTTWDYDDDGRLTSSSRLVALDMTNVASARTAYAYDALGQLAAGTTTFAYDAFGSLTNETVRNDGALAVVESIIDRFTDAFGRDAGYALNGVRQSTLAYDAVTGRLRSMAVPAEQSNNPNNLSSVALAKEDRTILSMSYDRMGRRVKKNDQRFVYNGYMQIADNKRSRRRQ